MRARIRRFEGLGGEEPGSYISPDPENDAFALRMIAGPSDGPGEESFDVLVCTPAWLTRTVAEQGPQIGRRHLVLALLNLTEAQDFLRRRVEQMDGPTWAVLAEKLNRLGHGEFEDYSPHEDE